MCLNGRLYVFCKEKCICIFVCGYVCSDFCWNFCFLCLKRCERGCVYKRNGCSYLCKNLCDLCEEMLNWICYDECENEFCSSEKCYKDYVWFFCNKWCKKLLICKFNYRCIGLCGENCLFICKRCDKKKLINIFRVKSVDDLFVV